MITFFRSALLATLIFFSFNVHADSVFQTKQLTLIETTEQSDSDVHELVKELSSVQGEALSSRRIGDQILALVKKKKNISEHDYLWTLYALIIGAGPEFDDGMPLKNYLEITDTALNYLDHNGVGEWVFTDQGQFKMEVYRQAANAAAWALKKTDPKKALAYIELGLGYMREEDMWLIDTHVRILLNLKDTDQAYAIVKAVLAERPLFGDFQDFTTDESYLAWLKTK